MIIHHNHFKKIAGSEFEGRIQIPYILFRF
jgi:hypothetical protein